MAFNQSYVLAAGEASTRIEKGATDLNDDSLRDEDVQFSTSKPSENELIPNKERVGPFDPPPPKLVKGKDYDE
jgi:hypothetical protein